MARTCHLYLPVKPGRALPVTSPKGTIGHTGASAGAMGLMAGLVAMHQGKLAPTMGMEMVEEYVETDELRTRMAALGVDYGQGFAIGRPVPIDQILGDLALYEAMAQQDSTPG